MTESELLHLAGQTFPPDRFVPAEDVCLFAEHTARDARGRRHRFDKAALAQLVRRGNQRIADTGTFAVLTAGHTPDREALLHGAPMPEVVGFVGPFRLGGIGRLRPRAAIYAHEWHFRDASLRLQKLPRRSVELWLTHDPAERFFDPVAALGAETPRLDLGLRLARMPGGETVEKFAVPAASSSLFKEALMLDSQDFDEIVQAFEKLDWVQFVKKQMAAAQETTAEPSGGDGSQASDDPGDPLRHSRDGDPIRYRRLEAEFATLRQAHETLQRSSVELARESADARRSARLDQLAAQITLDVEAEKNRCLYARGANLSDDQFQQRVELIEQYAQPLPLGRRLPRGEEPSQGPSQADRTQQAIAFADSRRREGRPVDWQTALDHVNQ
ncbi:hypothetical protein [Lignipirellula cremea]|uniref:Uncharacterized protein n=1 Tax=Lignipirellula cremea TaxID=2528010 RepID=A0A518E0B3_9BACT|nr:hypothetical protein [Lignipirellula cremea]QDU97527.1 hypothetical protein Pla8534_53750 [Lignipirellula cremea]